MSGNASEQCDVGASLLRSFLFLQTPVRVRPWWASQIARGRRGLCECCHSAKQFEGWKSGYTLSAVGSASDGSEKALGIDGRRPCVARRAVAASSFVLSPYPYPQLVLKLRKLLSR